MRRIVAIFLFTFLSSFSLHAQPQIWNIITNSGQPYPDVVLYRISGDTLIVKSLGNVYPVPVDSIKSLKRERESFSGLGLIAGMLVGGVVGNQVSENAASDKGMLNGLSKAVGGVFNTGTCIILGGILGFGIGSSAGSDEFIDLSRVGPAEKKTILDELIRRNQKQFVNQAHARSADPSK